MADQALQDQLAALRTENAALLKEASATNDPRLNVVTVNTTAYDDQKCGTSGLRKKTKAFQQENYTANFASAIFSALLDSGTVLKGGTLVLGGDGRYYSPEATQIIIKLAVAQGVTRIWVGQNSLLSTPGVSSIIREKRAPDGSVAFGGFILTASHNPGGPDEDFGMKYNCENGGPAPDKITEKATAFSKTIQTYDNCPDFPDIDLAALGPTVIGGVVVEIIDPAEEQTKLLAGHFDFPSIKKLLARPDFSMIYDCMHGVQGPYAKRIFLKELGADASVLMNADPSDDFGKGHADPNLTYAKELVKVMGVDQKGDPVDTGNNDAIPQFGSACDGDADRNMILGKQFFVTPCDSLAIIAHYAKDAIPAFAAGLKALSRSMPTSMAVDRVAEKMGIPLFETPTGWKYFGNLMDSACAFGKTDYTPFICGEESFGTSSDHVREKDGMWAALAWLSILVSSLQVEQLIQIYTTTDCCLPLFAFGS
jgi:phosphoglucomutase